MTLTCTRIGCARSTASGTPRRSNSRPPCPHCSSPARFRLVARTGARRVAGSRSRRRVRVFALREPSSRSSHCCGVTLWIDNQVPPALAAWMRATLSIECLPVRDLDLQRASDPEIFTAARSYRDVEADLSASAKASARRAGPPYRPSSSVASVAALSASVAAKIRFRSFSACSACALNRFDCSYCSRPWALSRL